MKSSVGVWKSSVETFRWGFGTVSASRFQTRRSFPIESEMPDLGIEVSREREPPQENPAPTLEEGERERAGDAEISKKKNTRGGSLSCANDL